MSKLNANSIEFGSLTTTQRNALSSVAAGTVIYNSTTGSLEGYNGTQWVDFGNLNFIDASGGTKSTSARVGYTVHTFTSPGTFSVSSSRGDVEFLVVAGGGSGGKGSYNGTGFETGGGGAGGYRTGTLPVVPGNYTVTIGGGGAATPHGYPGSDSVFSTITSTGGGSGGGNNVSPTVFNGAPGGSGGGGSHPDGTGGTGLSGQGFSGGNAQQNPNSGGGGGGASEVGNPAHTSGGTGGDGLGSSIDGVFAYRSGGGGGGNAPGPRAGGAGGGGQGGGNPGTNATDQTGGGGGGCASPYGTGGTGGSGIVIIAYQSS